jgi:hypothetical protein
VGTDSAAAHRRHSRFGYRKRCVLNVLNVWSTRLIVITRATEIISHDPLREVWKYLRLLNVDGTVVKISERHNVPKGEHEANLKKQGSRSAIVLRQGEEYFQASEGVDLATRPLLLYYGCVSLSQALVVVKKDGTFGLDASRRSGRHNHHGEMSGPHSHLIRTGTGESCSMLMASSIHAQDPHSHAVATVCRQATCG